MEILGRIILFVLGTCLGSFLNVVIHRLPRPNRGSLFSPGSRCPRCDAPIRPWENVPVLSFFLLRGRCRSCHRPIPWRYPAVELLAAGLLVTLQMRTGWTPPFAIQAVFVLFLIPIAFIDFEHQIIPDQLSLLGIAAGFLLLALLGDSGFLRAPHSIRALGMTLRDALLGCLLGAALLLAAAEGGKLVFRKESMGYGDVKLAAMMGVFLGWRQLLLALFLSFLLGAAVGVGLMLTGRKKRDSEMPFGPFLCLASLIAVLWGKELIHWYARVFWS